MTDLTLFEKEALRVALLHMFKPERWFSICELDAMVKVAGVTVPERTRATLHVLHCVSWSAMSPAMRQATAQTILSIFEQTPLDLPALDKSFLVETEAVASAGFFKKLFAPSKTERAS